MRDPAPSNTKPSLPEAQVAHRQYFKISAAQKLIFSIAFGTAYLCFFLMSYAKENKQQAALPRVNATALINGVLYGVNTSKLLLNLPTAWKKFVAKIKEKGIFNSDLFRLLITSNFAITAALMMPGDFFSIRGLYPDWVLWSVGSVMLIQESFLLYQPIKKIMLDPFEKLLSSCLKTEKKEAPSEHTEPLLEAPSKQSDQKQSDQKLSKNSFLSKISWHTLLLSPFLAFLAIPFQLGATGSMERAATQMKFLRYLPISALCNILLIGNPIASSFAGISMLFLFVYFPIQALPTLINTLILEPIKHFVRMEGTHQSPCFKLPGFLNWLLTAGIVGLCSYGLTSALAIETEGQSKMIQDGGIPGFLVNLYRKIHLGTYAQVLILGVPLNSTGLLELWENLVTQVKFYPGKISFKQYPLLYLASKAVDLKNISNEDRQGFWRLASDNKNQNQTVEKAALTLAQYHGYTSPTESDNHAVFVTTSSSSGSLTTCHLKFVERLS